jgi:hypothetical protein
MKYIDFKHQRENKQNSDKNEISVKVVLSTITPNHTNNTSCMQRKRLEKDIIESWKVWTTNDHVKNNTI